MIVFAETDRLILREMLSSDAAGMYELDGNAAVHKYLGNLPVQSIEQSKEMIAFIRQQYVENGIGRWAVIEKETNQFIGWAGLKLVMETINGHTNFYDVGYRFIPKFWGKGYATEAAIASVAYGFEKLCATVLYGMANTENVASKKVLQKAGMQYVNSFSLKGMPHNWFEVRAKYQ